MGTKQNPGAFDCYSNAELDEPMFVLLARDPLAPTTVLAWATCYAGTKAAEGGGMLTEAQLAKYDEAVKCAEDMKRWQQLNPR